MTRRDAIADAFVDYEWPGVGEEWPDLPARAITTLARIADEVAAEWDAEHGGNWLEVELFQVKAERDHIAATRLDALNLAERWRLRAVRAEAERDRRAAALAFYADAQSWEAFGPILSEAATDRGAEAREALAALSGDRTEPEAGGQ